LPTPLQCRRVWRFYELAHRRSIPRSAANPGRERISANSWGVTFGPRLPGAAPGRGARSIPNWPAVACRHASLPKGVPRRNDRSSASTAPSVCGSLTWSIQFDGGATGQADKPPVRPGAE
jgi:hypothetical protein